MNEDEMRQQVLQEYLSVGGSQNPNRKNPKDLIGAKPKTMFLPREGVDMNLLGGDLEEVEKLLRQAGIANIPVSSTGRTVDEIRRLKDQRKEAYNLTDYPERTEEVIDQVLLRGESPDNINMYPSGDPADYPEAYGAGQNWRSKATENLIKSYMNPIENNLTDKQQQMAEQTRYMKAGKENLSDNIPEILDNLANARKTYGGMQTDHAISEGQPSLAFDIPESTTGKDKFKRIMKALQNRDTILEKVPGYSGDVLHVNLEE